MLPAVLSSFFVSFFLGFVPSKNRMHWALFYIVFSSFHLYAQDDVIQSERNELAILVEQSLWDEIDLTNNKVEDYFILTGHEKEWLHLLKQDFSGFFETYHFNEDYYESSKLQRAIRQDFSARYFGVAEYFASFDTLGKVLQQQFRREIENIALAALNSSIDEEQKRFLQLYLAYYKYQFDVCSQEQLNVVGQAFNRQKFEKQEFNDFVIKYENTLSRLTDKSMLFGIGLGINTLLQKPSNIGAGFAFNFLFDYNFKHFYFGSRILIHQHKTKTAFTSKPEYDENRPFGLFYFDVYLGATKAFMDAKVLVQPYVGYGFGFFRGVNEIDEPNFSTTQVNSGFFGLKSQYVFSRERMCEDRVLFVNQQHYAAFFDVSYRVNPFGVATPEILGRGLLFNVGLVINNPLLKKHKVLGE